MRRLVILLVLVGTAFAQTASTSPTEPVAQENSAKAKAVLDQAIQALGGDAYLNIQDVSQQGRTYSFHHGETTSTGILFWRFLKFPDKERIEVTKEIWFAGVEALEPAGAFFERGDGGDKRLHLNFP